MKKLWKKLFPVLLSILFFSCDGIEWGVNFLDDINSTAGCKFTYYKKENPLPEDDSFSVQHFIGQKVNVSQMISESENFYGKKNEWDREVLFGFKSIGNSEGVTTTADGDVSEINIKTNNMEFVPVYGYKYKVRHVYESNSNYEEDESLLFESVAKDGTVITPELHVKENYLEPVISTFTINKNDWNDFGVFYKKKRVHISFNANGGYFEPMHSSNINFDAPIGDSFDSYLSFVTTPEMDSRTFIRWEPEIPEKVPDTDTTYRAVWSGVRIYLTYLQKNINSTASLSGNNSHLPASYVSDQKIVIPEPDSTFTGSENELSFAGWYYYSTCNEADKLPKDEDGNYYIPAGHFSTDATLYAKWNFKRLYVNPGFGGSGDSGLTKSSANGNLAQAIDAMKTEKNSFGEEIVILSSIYSDIDKLSGTYAAGCGYGADGNGIVFKKGIISNGDYNFIQVTGDTVITGACFDGGAVWSNGNAYDGTNVSVNTGVSGDGTFICNGSFSGSYNVTLNCEIRNFENKNSGGSLINVSMLVLNFSGKITDCKADSIISGYNSYTLDNCTVRNCVTKNSVDESVFTCAYGADISNTEIDTVSGNAIYNNGNLNLENVKIKNCSGYGLYNYTSGVIQKLADADFDMPKGIYLKGTTTINADTFTGAVRPIVVEADNYNTGRLVLTGQNTNIAARYTMLKSGHEGYEIYSNGKFIAISSGGITPSTPSSPTEIPLGTLSTHHVVKPASGDTKVIFNVTDEAYEKIADWSPKCIQFTIDGYYCKASITGTSGNYQAELNLSKDNNGNSITLEPGIKSIMIFADAETTDTETVFIPLSEEIIITEP